MELGNNERLVRCFGLKKEKEAGGGKKALQEKEEVTECTLDLRFF